MIKDDRRPGRQPRWPADVTAGDLPAHWLAELVAGRAAAPITPAEARTELDLRGKAIQETLCIFLDAVTSSLVDAMGGSPRPSGSARRGAPVGIDPDRPRAHG
jgi:hypothetical protein